MIHNAAGQDNSTYMNLILLFPSDFTDASMSLVRLSGHRREHAVSVCNVEVGFTLKVGLINGNMGTAVVLEITDTVLDLQVTLDEHPPTSLPLTLICALPRPKSLFKCIEVATVMGVKTMYFINSYRVEKNYWGSQRLEGSELKHHMIIGLEQSRDTILPKLEFRRRFKPFVEDELSAIINDSRALVAHPYAAQPCPYHCTGPITLIIGPEGGFIPYEIEMLQKQDVEAVSFGARILRVEHAVAALIGRIL